MDMDATFAPSGLVATVFKPAVTAIRAIHIATTVIPSPRVRRIPCSIPCPAGGETPSRDCGSEKKGSRLADLVIPPAQAADAAGADASGRRLISNFRYRARGLAKIREPDQRSCPRPVGMRKHRTRNNPARDRVKTLRHDDRVVVRLP